MKRFVVVDQENATSGTDDGEFEGFDSYDKAEERAEELAALSPGDEYGVFERVATSCTPVGKVATVKDKAAG